MVRYLLFLFIRVILFRIYFIYNFSVLEYDIFLILRFRHLTLVHIKLRKNLYHFGFLYLTFFLLLN